MTDSAVEQATLATDDEVDDFRYIWHGPAGAESWWPARPLEHVVIYVQVLLPAAAIGVAWGLAVGWNATSRLVPVLAWLLAAWALVDAGVKHVDPVRPLAWHRLTLHRELRAPRPARGRSRTIVTSIPPRLLGPVPARGWRRRGGRR